MNFFVFRSGIPFASLAFYGGLLAAIVVGGTMGIWRWNAGSRRAIWKPACLVLGALAVLAFNVYADESLELNPRLADTDVIGEWTDGGAVLTLERNGAFTCRGGAACSSLGASGRWARRGDVELAFQRADGHTIIRRVIQWGHDYHLTEMPDDPDLWDGELTFQIRVRASEPRLRLTLRPAIKAQE